MMRFPLRWLPALAAIVLAANAIPRAEDAPATPVRDRAIYGHVSHVGWVVHDLDTTIAVWRRLGLTDVSPVTMRRFSDVVQRGRSIAMDVKMATARFRNARVEWMQPVSDGNPLAEFLSRHGDGVHHLAYALPSAERLREEAASFKTSGVDALATGAWQGTAGTGRFVYLDTAPQAGGLTIELEHDPDTPVQEPAACSSEDPFCVISQYAFVVRDVHAVSAYLGKVGLGGLPVERNVSLDRRFRGRPGTFEMLLGWGRGGDVVFEWIEPVTGPSVYDEYLAQHGEGFHHLGFNVSDMDGTLKRLESRGLSVTMSGGWNVNGHIGRFAYLDSDRFGGVTIELLWNKPGS